MKFYDVVGKKSVNVPESKVKYVTKKGKKRTVKMATAIGPKGNKMFRIVG